MGTFAFAALMNRFRAHMKLTASKWYAKHKIAQLEAAAANEDAAQYKKDNSKRQKRAFNFEVMDHTSGRWD